MILDLLFPKYCLECKTEGKYICKNCLHKVRFGGWKDNNYSVFKYEGVIRKAIIALKYKYARDVVEELVSYIFENLKNRKTYPNSEPIILAPVPLHWRRENWRGFNQSEVIGKELAVKIDWKFIPDLLTRKKFTKPQVELRGTERKINLTEVFFVNQNYLSSDQLFNSSIILFDDVYTT